MRNEWIATARLAAAIFIAAAIVFSAIFLTFPLIPDGDSYFHLAVARLYAEHGFVRHLDWARFSVMANGFGDKELLFHALLIPFTRNPSVGGRIALALFNAAIFTIIAILGICAVGKWGAVAAPIVYVTAGSFIARAFRLRPELLSLLLLLAAAWAASRRKYGLLFVFSVAYALSYTAFQTLLGLAVLWVIVESLQQRRVEWKPIAIVAGGIALGILIHPNFPSNLRIWFVQNVVYFRLRDSLDVGPEIFSIPASDVLLFNLGWWPALWLFWRSGRRDVEPIDDDRRAAAIFAITAAVFGLLFLLMDRMSIYFFPFATLAVLFAMRNRGMTMRPNIALAALVLCAIASFPREWFIVHTLRTTGVAEADYAAMSAKVPPGATIAAPWGPAEEYALWMPGARYLNVLDPVFMAVANRDVYRIQRAVFAGRDPDVPLSVAAALRSEFIAFERVTATRMLEQRLRHDPRVVVLHSGGNFLARILPNRNQGFVLEWDKYPHVRNGIEGYVNALRVARDEDRCVALTTPLTVARPIDVDYELAPYGPAILSFDDQPRVAIQDNQDAILGKGVIVPLRLTPGLHRLRVETCRGDGGAMGFYLLERSRKVVSPAEIGH